MDATAVDILGAEPPLTLSKWTYIEAAGLVIEIRADRLEIRNVNGGIIVRPVVSNVIAVEPEPR